MPLTFRAHSNRAGCKDHIKVSFHGMEGVRSNCKANKAVHVHIACTGLLSPPSCTPRYCSRRRRAVFGALAAVRAFTSTITEKCSVYLSGVGWIGMLSCRMPHYFVLFICSIACPIWLHSFLLPAGSNVCVQAFPLGFGCENSIKVFRKSPRSGDIQVVI